MFLFFFCFFIVKSFLIDYNQCFIVVFNFLLSSSRQCADLTVFSESGHYCWGPNGGLRDVAGIPGPQSALALPHYGNPAR